MKRPNLKKYLLNWLNTHAGEWHKKVSLYSVGDEIEFSPESVGRALRSLEEEGRIKVSYYDGVWAKNLCKYSANDYTQKKLIPTLVQRNGQTVAIFD